MLFLQHDQMLELVKLEQAALRRQVAQEALLPPAANRVQNWTLAILGRLRSALQTRPKPSLEEVAWPRLGDYAYCQCQTAGEADCRC